MEHCTRCRRRCRRAKKGETLQHLSTSTLKNCVGFHFLGELFCQGAQKWDPIALFDTRSSKSETLSDFLTPGDQKVKPYHTFWHPQTLGSSRFSNHSSNSRQSGITAKSSFSKEVAFPWNYGIPVSFYCLVDCQIEFWIVNSIWSSKFGRIKH